MKVIFISVCLIGLVCATQCIDAFASHQETDRWLLITPPIGSFTNGQYGYVWSKADVEQDFGMFKASQGTSKEVKTRVEGVFLEHVRAATEKNLDLLGKFKDTRPNTRDLSIKNKLNVFQMWAQHDYSDLRAINVQFGEKTMPKDIKSSARDINRMFVPSHSKWLFTYDFQSNEGYMILHSYTNIPSNLYPTNDYVTGTPYIFSRKEKKDGELEDEPDDRRFSYSQYAYCFSFKEEQALALVKMMKDVYPPITNYNFHPFYLPDSQVSTKLQELLNPALLPHTNIQPYWKYLDDEALKCLGTFWRGHWQYAAATACTVPTISFSGLKIIGHRSLPQLVQDPTTAKQDLEEAKFLDVGPWPWNAVAEIINEELTIHHFVSEKDVELLSIPARKKFWKVTRFQLNIPDENSSKDPLNVQWTKNEVHHKIAYGNNPASSFMVCFGDANHVAIQIHHAGIAVCFDSSIIWLELVKMMVKGDKELKSDNLTVRVNKKNLQELREMIVNNVPLQRKQDVANKNPHHVPQNPLEYHQQQQQHHRTNSMYHNNNNRWDK